MIIKLIRHGESLSNVGEMKPHLVGDAGIGLSEPGKRQAFAAGTVIGLDFAQARR